MGLSVVGMVFSGAGLVRAATPFTYPLNVAALALNGLLGIFSFGGFAAAYALLAVQDLPTEDQGRMQNYRNRNARLFLGGSAAALLAGWLFVAFILRPLIRAPSPWTEIGGALWLAGGWILLSLKIPLSVEISEDAIALRRLLGTNRILRSRISQIEYRILENYLDKPVDLKYYTITIKEGTKRLADFGVDGRIAHRLMSWFDPARSTLKIYRGEQLIEERSLGS